MAVEVEVTGNGIFAGAKSNIGGYSVSEESTPVEASDTTGGAGQLTFSAVEAVGRFGSSLLLNDDVTLTDGDRGTTVGKINAVTSNDGILNVTADSRLGRLVTDVSTVPVDGTFEDAILYYLELGGITDDIAIDTSLTAIPVMCMGWTGDLWTKIKELLVTVGAEISLVRGDVVIRPVRQRRALEINNVSESWTVSNVDLAKKIEVYYYEYQDITNGLIYPYGGWTSDVEVHSVDANAVKEVNLPVDVSLTDLVPPVVQDTVGRFDTGSVYSVSGNDGLPIPAAQWTATGGKLEVSIGEDGKSIDLKITGPYGTIGEKYSPYSIAVSSGSGEYYSTLRIQGSGIGFKQQSYVVPTGADDSSTSRDVGVTVDNLFISTLDQAKELAIDVAAKWSAPQRSINISKADLNKPGSSNYNFDYATFAEFDEYADDQGLVTFSDFDSFYSGQTFADFDNYWYELVKNEFDFQVFGNANGARVQYRRAMYRIRSAEVTESGVSYTAEADTTFEDFDEHAAGLTFGDFDDAFAGMTFSDFTLIPLINVEPEYDR